MQLADRGLLTPGLDIFIFIENAVSLAQLSMKMLTDQLFRFV